MKIVIAPDSFKGSLSSEAIISIVTQSALARFADAEISGVPIADGGDGTVAALVRASGGRTITTTARDPLGRHIQCVYGITDTTAIIGMSECSGLALLSAEEHNPLETSSHGVGDVILAALDAGIRDILLGIGGSATNDGGTGCLQALGVRFFRADGDEIPRMCGDELAQAARIDASGIDKRLASTSITIMCDVTNPLTGDHGATYTYGPQKGGTKKMLDDLEAGMSHFAALLDAHAGRAVSDMPGAGAAGGIGAALHGFTGAALVRGIDAVLSFVQFDQLIADADIIITGEGRIDEQSAYGKVIHGVTQYARDAHVPVIALTGGVGPGADAVYDLGVHTIAALPNAPMTLEDCIQNADALLKDTADRVFALIDVGYHLR